MSRLLLRLLTANFYSRMNIIKKGRILWNPPDLAVLPRNRSMTSTELAYCPEVAVLADAAPAAGFGTLMYPVAVDLVTLLTTNSIAARVPPV